MPWTSPEKDLNGHCRIHVYRIMNPTSMPQKKNGRRSRQNHQCGSSGTPKRSAALDRLEWRSIQIGVGGDAVPRYASEWVTSITDITSTVHRIAASENMTRTSLLNEILAHERPYPLSSAIAARIGATPKDSS